METTNEKKQRVLDMIMFRIGKCYLPGSSVHQRVRNHLAKQSYTFLCQLHAMITTSEGR